MVALLSNVVFLRGCIRLHSCGSGNNSIVGLARRQKLGRSDSGYDCITCIKFEVQSCNILVIVPTSYAVQCCCRLFIDGSF